MVGGRPPLDHLWLRWQLNAFVADTYKPLGRISFCEAVGTLAGHKRSEAFNGFNTAVRLDATHGIKARIVPPHKFGSYEYPAIVGRCRLDTAAEESHVLGRKKQVPGPLVEKFYHAHIPEVGHVVWGVFGSGGHRYLGSRGKGCRVQGSYAEVKIAQTRLLKTPCSRP